MAFAMPVTKQDKIYPTFFVVVLPANPTIMLAQDICISQQLSQLTLLVSREGCIWFSV